MPWPLILRKATSEPAERGYLGSMRSESHSPVPRKATTEESPTTLASAQHNLGAGGPPRREI